MLVGEKAVHLFPPEVEEVGTESLVGVYKAMKEGRYYLVSKEAGGHKIYKHEGDVGR